MIREACTRHRGVEVDTQGDAFFFAFPTAPGALAAAGEMTEALASGRVQVRIGLHTGTPLVTEEGYIGGDVHRAARIAASGHGGQVLVSSIARALADGAGLPFDDLGEMDLKNIAGRVRVYRVSQLLRLRWRGLRPPRSCRRERRQTRRAASPGCRRDAS